MLRLIPRYDDNEWGIYAYIISLLRWGQAFAAHQSAY